MKGVDVERKIVNNKRTRLFVISATTQQPFIIIFHLVLPYRAQWLCCFGSKDDSSRLLVARSAFLFHFIIHVGQTTT